MFDGMVGEDGAAEGGVSSGGGGGGVRAVDKIARRKHTHLCIEHLARPASFHSLMAR